MTPVSSVRSAAVLVDVHNGDFRKAESIIRDYFGKKQIHLDIIYIDYTRYRKGEQTATAPEWTIYKKDLNWFGKPLKTKSSSLLSSQKDIFISLSQSNDFTVMLASTAFPAKFKIGCSSFNSDPFNIVVSPSQETGADTADLFRNIAAILESIR